jgi:hypothetical protein
MQSEEVEKSLEYEEERWGRGLAKHGYFLIEKDINIHVKPWATYVGKIGFWKERDIDGVILEPLEVFGATYPSRTKVKLTDVAYSHFWIPLERLQIEVRDSKVVLNKTWYEVKEIASSTKFLRFLNGNFDDFLVKSAREAGSKLVFKIRK